MLKDSPLGKTSSYISIYQADLLFPIARKKNRDEIGLNDDLPFKGWDVWNAYELSWLNSKGKPVVALGEFIFSCNSPNLIESKSFKLYLNSFNNSSFDSLEHVKEILKRDLTNASGQVVQVYVIPMNQVIHRSTRNYSGICLDDLDVECDKYLVDATLLTTENEVTNEIVYSDLLKSNCLVTGQPDWASIQIKYSGKKINHESLLKYIISFRNHNEFHEQCVERIFTDILTRCKPNELTVEARYTRRGGLDINPLRSTNNDSFENYRLCRQ